MLTVGSATAMGPRGLTLEQTSAFAAEAAIVREASPRGSTQAEPGHALVDVLRNVQTSASSAAGDSSSSSSSSSSVFAPAAPRRFTAAESSLANPLEGSVGRGRAVLATVAPPAVPESASSMAGTLKEVAADVSEAIAELKHEVGCGNTSACWTLAPGRPAPCSSLRQLSKK